MRVLGLLIGGCGLAHQKGGRDRKAIIWLVFVADSWGGLPANVGPNTLRRASVPSNTVILVVVGGAGVTECFHTGLWISYPIPRRFPCPKLTLSLTPPNPGFS